MITDIYKDLVNDRPITIENVIDQVLTELGSGLYAYMYMLDNTERKSEATLIMDLRNIIFDARDSFRNKKISKIDISIALDKVYTLLTVQVTMLRTSPERSWEAGFFQSNLNEILDFKYLMNPNKSSRKE